MKWISTKKTKPPVDTPILVFRHGFDVTGTRYWSHIEIAEYVKPPYKKRLLFATNVTREKNGQVYGGFPLDGVSHWLPLPEPPRQKISWLAPTSQRPPKRLNNLPHPL